MDEHIKIELQSQNWTLQLDDCMIKVSKFRDGRLSIYTNSGSSEFTFINSKASRVLKIGKLIEKVATLRDWVVPFACETCGGVATDCHCKE